MDGEIRVFAELRAKPGHEATLGEVLRDCVAPTRTEPGCRSYVLHEEVGAPGHFFFYEAWADQAALERHTRTPHFKMLVERSRDLLAAPLAVTVTREIA